MAKTKNQDPKANKPQEPQEKTQQELKENQVNNQDQTAPEPNPEPKEQIQEPKPDNSDKELKEIDFAGKYERYTELKMIELSGSKLKEPTKQEMITLEKQLKTKKGKKAKMTVRAAINNEVVKLIDGIPVTDAIEKIINDAGKSDYYLS